MWRRRDGFTFLELAVVVTIIGIMMAVTMPRFSSSFSRATLGGAARRLAGTMGYLRNAAARDGRGYFLNIDLDNEQYYVTVINEEADASETEYEGLGGDDGEFYAEFSDAFVGRRRLEKKIAFSEVMLGDEPAVVDGRVRIEFRPDGTADEAVIHLTNPSKRVYTVYVEHYDGQARVYDFEFVPEPPPTLTERERANSPRDAL